MSISLVASAADTLEGADLVDTHRVLVTRRCLNDALVDICRQMTYLSTRTTTVM